MPAEHIQNLQTGRDEMHLGAVVVVLYLDGNNLPVVEVNTQPDEFFTVLHNHTPALVKAPTPAELTDLQAAAAAEEAAKSRNEKIKDLLEGKVPATATTEELIALVNEAAATVDQAEEVRNGGTRLDARVRP